MAIDEIDINILRELSLNARAPLSFISKKVNLSIPSVSERIKRLNKEGYIEKYTIVLNPKAFNKKLICFCFLNLRSDEIDADKHASFYELVRSEADIIECHTITGEYEYLLKIISKGPEELEKLLVRLRKKGGVLTSSTSISLSTIKNEVSF